MQGDAALAGRGAQVRRGAQEGICSPRKGDSPPPWGQEGTPWPPTQPCQGFCRGSVALPRQEPPWGMAGARSWFLPSPHCSCEAFEPRTAGWVICKGAQCADARAESPSPTEPHLWSHLPRAKVGNFGVQADPGPLDGHQGGFQKGMPASPKHPLCSSTWPPLFPGLGSPWGSESDLGLVQSAP